MRKEIAPITDSDKRKASIALFCKGEPSIADWVNLTGGSYSHNSLLGFRKDWINFLEFCQLAKVNPLPAAVTTVRRHLEKLAETRKLASIKRCVATLSLIHRVHQLTDPTRHRQIRFCLQSLGNIKADDAAKTQPFRIEHLEKLQKQIGNSSRLKDIRDLLIWTLSLEALLKRSELCALEVSDIWFDGNSANINVDGQTLGLSDHASTLLNRWFMLTEISDGHLLRRIDRHENLGSESMDHSSVYRVFRRASEMLGLTGELVFSGQSARAGAALDLSKAGFNLSDIQSQGRWRSPAMPAQYAGLTGHSEEAFTKHRKKVERE
ncbi:tyrosine-type recombinase/integrase [Parasalinivibrio latis]|uniref:tyrosine-type recombinase/integrase n=1 Tax=Parasalinivibrio latis TaxID=2952610 RepID=UPI0030DFD801